MAREHQIQANRANAIRSSGFITKAGKQVSSQNGPKLTQNFGTWKTPCGDINRFERLNDDIAPAFSDSAPSIPVGFTSSSQMGITGLFRGASLPGHKEVVRDQWKQLHRGGGVRRSCTR
jgi:hypothetical protein